MDALTYHEGAAEQSGRAGPPVTGEHVPGSAAGRPGRVQDPRREPGLPRLQLAAADTGGRFPSLPAYHRLPGKPGTPSTVELRALVRQGPRTERGPGCRTGSETRLLSEAPVHVPGDG